MADWNRFSKKKNLENLYKGQNLKVRKFQIHRTLESKVIKRKPTGGAHCAPPAPSTNRVKKEVVCALKRSTFPKEESFPPTF